MKQLALIALILLAACKDETISGYAEDGAVWQLESINGAAFKARATLTFPQPGKIAGSGPCNRYFGKQTAPYPWFSVDGVASTKRACPDMRAESVFFESLRKMTLSEATGATLILSNDAGDQMIFKTSE
ncbi:Heat shock protein HslJ [Litoreibacter ascidiaceicola]|uniref:Heat shock protein HslJ n=1 Tax=Litoreibacter ascidiaceicola TaxID=1486859 RepID=A0A1M4XG75_9RHOB|nr:META domain-containing protein [Litoreibacter ascidiaceicola]SHE92182.1 Heat shock protein HslJ [Litoreibacter ascidiaceicola]